MKPSGVIIDVGKGNFTDKGLEKASQLGIRLGELIYIQLFLIW